METQPFGGWFPSVPSTDQLWCLTRYPVLGKTLQDWTLFRDLGEDRGRTGQQADCHGSFQNQPPALPALPTAGDSCESRCHHVRSYHARQRGNQSNAIRVIAAMTAGPKKLLPSIAIDTGKDLHTAPRNHLNVNSPSTFKLGQKITKLCTRHLLARVDSCQDRSHVHPAHCCTISDSNRAISASRS